jgi:hypothetical protein
MTARRILEFTEYQSAKSPAFQISRNKGYSFIMDIEEKERLTDFRDTSDQAVSRRLAAARIAIGLNQKQLAEAVDLKHKTYATQEKLGRPSVAVIRFLYRNHFIDFNFILHGDFQQLPGATQTALFEALASIGPSHDLRSSSR